MTVEELKRRITVPELQQWQALARVEAKERDTAERIARVEAKARQNRMNR